MSGSNDRSERRRKYDRGAATYSERFADPGAIARRQRMLLEGWGTPVRPGAKVLELGCADGLVTEELARAGYRVTAIDLSPRMVATARRRLDEAGLKADVLVGDIECLPFHEPFDGVLAMMRTFFAYVPDPVSVLERIRSLTATKVLADADPRRYPRRACEEALRTAGFVSVAWRPNFVPQRRAGPILGRALRLAEEIPGARDVILRRKFSIVLCGERRRV